MPQVNDSKRISAEGQLRELRERQVPHQSPNPLARIEAAHRLLAEARTIDEVKDVRDKAAAAALYARERGYSQDMIDYASEIKVRAERKAGFLLADIERTPAAERHISSAPRMKSSPYQEMLAETKLSPQTAHRWQQMAVDIEEPVFEQAMSEVKAEGKGITTAAVARTARARAERDVEATVAEELPDAAEKLARARLKAAAMKGLVALREWISLNPEAVAAVLSEEDYLSFCDAWTRGLRWAEDIHAQRRQGIRLVKGAS